MRTHWRAFARPLLTATLAALLVGLTATPAEAFHGWHARWFSQDPYPILAPGAVNQWTIRFRNEGSQTWIRGVSGRQVNLAVARDDESFARQGFAVNWYAPSRPAAMTEQTVLPGQFATFSFSVRAPAQGTSYRIFLHPVVEGLEHLEDEGAYIEVRGDVGFHSLWVSQSAYPTVGPGQTTPAMTISFRNTGTRAWVRGSFGQQANLGLNGDDRRLAPYAVAWPTPDRVAIQNETRVEPGQVGTFTFQMRGPSAPGVYQLHLRAVIDGVTWMEDQGVYMFVTVR